MMRGILSLNQARAPQRKTKAAHDCREGLKNLDARKTCWGEELAQAI
jgi:hypothetical protein